MQACANTLNWRAKHALNCELRVLEHFLKNNYTLLYHRPKICGVEIDLVLQSPWGRVVCIEVKSNSSDWPLQDRLTKTQIQRLYRVDMYLEQKLYTAVEFQVVLVAKTLEFYLLKNLI
ncbi:MAG: YraN family protein [Bdellovibrionaceae bacterium]|nr:YraN family protein [Pseudobdellovibrionaceae bacterium]